MITIAGELLLLYLLYKFVFNFIVPVYLASQKVKHHFREMSQQGQSYQPDQPVNRQPESKSKVTAQDEEYIDYEEIK